MYQLRGMRTSLSPQQWQPWTAVSSSLYSSASIARGERFSLRSLTVPYVCFSAEAHAVMKSVRRIFVSSAIFVVFTSFYLLHIQPLWPNAHCNCANFSLCSFEAHGSSAWHLFRHKTLPCARHFRYKCGFLSSRIPYYANGTSTFRLIKVRLSEDVEENPGPAITGVRGVSGGKIVSFIFPT